MNRQKHSIRITSQDFGSLHAHLFQDQNEQHAFLFGSLITSNRESRLLINDQWLAGPREVIRQTPTFIEIDPCYALNALDRCRKEGLHIVDVHSHPFAGKSVAFSPIDLACYDRRETWHRRESPSTNSYSLVLGRESMMGTVANGTAGPRSPLQAIDVVGADWWQISQSCEVLPPGHRYDRQVRAFGVETQQRLSQLEVGIVGLGGLGSALLPQLAMAGVRRFVLVDHDIVEETNLNRLYGATQSDIAQPKIVVSERVIKQIHPEAVVQTVQAEISSSSAREALKFADFVFGALDNDGARLTLAEIAARYLIPYIDMGSGITMQDNHIHEAGGQACLWLPKQTCPICAGSISPERAAIDLRDSSISDIAREHYGTREPAPAVASLNMTIASIAASELLMWVSGNHSKPGMVSYDFLRRSTEPIGLPRPRSGCPLCARIATGDPAEHSTYSRRMPHIS